MSFHIRSHTQEQSNALAVELLDSYQQYLRTRETTDNGRGSLDQTLGLAMGMREACKLTLFHGTDMGYLPDLVSDYKARMSTLSWEVDDIKRYELFKVLVNGKELNPDSTKSIEGDEKNGNVTASRSANWKIGSFGNSDPLDLSGLTEAERALIERVEYYRKLHRQLIERCGGSGRDSLGAHVITLHQARGMKHALDKIKNTKEAQSISYTLQAQLY